MSIIKTNSHIPIVNLPPSKSLSHRALICGALAGEGSQIINLGIKGEDVHATISCLSKMGLEYLYNEDKLQILKGISSQTESALALDCGESGSTLRFLLPLAMLEDMPVIMTGRGRLMQRPVKEYALALESNGGKIHFEEDGIRVKGPIRPGRYELPGDISSQYISGLLMALPLLKGDSEINLITRLESKPYVDLTLDVMKSFGVTGKAVENGYIIKGSQQYKPCIYKVEGDFSAAAFFLVAGALGYDVGCMGLNTKSVQGDAEILRIIRECGGTVTVNEKGCIYATAKTLNPIVIDVRNFPDLVPPLAVLLCFCQGVSSIIGAKRLRLKESDRLHSLATQLNSIGANIIEEEDSLLIKGIKELKGGTVDPHNDHRIAMALAIASLRSENKVKIINADCVNKSYPGFWDDFLKLGKANIEPLKEDVYE